MKSKIYWIIILCMFACNISLYWLFYKERNNTRSFNTTQQIMMEKENLNYLLYESLDESITDNLHVYWGKEKKDSFKLSILAKEPKLIFRYSTTMCRPCIDDAIFEIKEVFPNYEVNENIVFSCKNLENRLKESYLGKRNLSFTYLDNIPIEKHQIPYLFILDKDLKIKKAFHCSQKQ